MSLTALPSPPNSLSLSLSLSVRGGGGLDTSTTQSVLVVRGDKKGTQCPGVYLGHPVPVGYKYGNLALQVGGVSDETVKYGREF
jgi:hypothetical protein